MASAERFARQLILPGFGSAAQEALAAARVLVIGAGGLGSAVIPALAAAGAGTIEVVDDDVVELSNLPRQLIHGTGDVGTAKTASAAAAVARLNPEATVVEHALRFRSDTALELATGVDLIVDGSDNFPTRYLADDVAVLRGIPLVWGAVSQFAGQAGVAWAERGPHYRDLFPAPPPPGSVLSCAEGGVFPTTVAVIGAIMAAEALKVLTGVGDPLLGRVVLYDALTAEFRELAFGRDPEAVPVTGLVDYEAFCGVPAHTGAAPGTTIGTANGADAAAASLALTPAELAAELARDPRIQLIDVRESWEHEVVAIPGSRLVPLGILPDAVTGLDRHAPVILFCHHGIRSLTALEFLRGRGFDDVRHLAGGIDAWAREIAPGLPRY